MVATEHPEPSSPKTRREDTTGERRLSGLQRALRWIAWLTFLGLAIKNSQSTSFGGLEFLALAAAIGVSIWCMARPLGGVIRDIEGPRDVRGEFVSRTNWALLLIGVILLIGGIGASGAIAYDLATGRASVGDVLRDIAIFVEGWFVEIFTKGAFDAELEKTHAYALFVLLLPGFALLAFNIGPVWQRGKRFRVEPDGSVAHRRGGGWVSLHEFEYQRVEADGSRIVFHPNDSGQPTVTLPQGRVFSIDRNTRLKAPMSASFFRERLASQGFDVDDSTNQGSFTAQR